MPPSADKDAAGQGQLSGQNTRPESWRAFCISIVRIVVLEIVLLLALSGAFIAYLNWSSEVSFAEFLAASATAASHSSPQPINGHTPCERGA